jgi:hypothetical protein
MFCRHTRSNSKQQQKHTINFDVNWKDILSYVLVFSSLPPTIIKTSQTIQATSKAYNSQQQQLGWRRRSFFILKLLHLVIKFLLVLSYSNRLHLYFEYMLLLLSFPHVLNSLSSHDSVVLYLSVLLCVCTNANEAKWVRWKWKQKTEILWSRWSCRCYCVRVSEMATSSWVECSC